MKKGIAIALLAAILLCFAACGEKTYSIDTEALGAALNEAGIFLDTLAELPAGMLPNFYSVAENVTAVLYRGTGATAEEITIFDALDADSAATVAETAQKRLTELAGVYDQYNATEAARLRNAICLRRGRYVVVCVCNDNAAEQKIIDQFFAA